MAFVYNQPLAHRFGVELLNQIQGGDWTTFDAAVAWVRRSGTRHLMPTLTDFLHRRGILRLVVGIDIENTSKEGLEDLLSLAEHGDARTFVYHNEYPTVTFHPKVYLFSNDKHARLIIGSNNLTESGLFTNVETGLQVDAAPTDPVILQVQAALNSWRNPSDELVRLLDPDLLNELVRGGYVATEGVIQRRKARQRRNSGSGGGERRLFGSRSVVAPPPPPPVPFTAPMAQEDESGRILRPRLGGNRAPKGGTGDVRLIRPRLARGGTQMQIPKSLREGPFFRDVGRVTSEHDNTARPIRPTHPKRAGGKVNTYKLELPEGAGIENPVMRVWHTADGVFYRVYAANSPEGRFILNSLEEGRLSDPPLTTVTKPWDPYHSTWYRSI
jgi:HKD family nuclease